MFGLIEKTDFTAVRTLLVSVPESLELLVFGIGLVVAVVMLRWFLGKKEAEKTDEEFSKRA